MPLVPLARQSLPGSDPYSSERLVNYFARQSDGVAPIVLLSRSGLVETVTPRAGRVRALVTMGGALYAVSGGAVWKIVDSTATYVGSVFDGPTDIAASATQIAIVVGGFYYICDGATTRSYATGSVSAPAGVEVMGGYFVVIGRSAGRPDALTVSALDDGTKFDTLDFAFAESSPDELVAILRDHDSLWLFGADSVQVFYNAGAADFPFQPVGGGMMEHGCLPNTPASAANVVFWIKPNGTVMSAGGIDPRVISTPEVKAALEASEIIRAYTFSERGHEFYAVVRAGDTSLVYDITTGLWAERSTGLAYGPWAAECSALLAGTTYYGCAEGQIATADAEVYDDFGAVLLGEVVTQPIQQGADEFSIYRLHVNFSGGTVDIGRKPKVVMQTSRDGRKWGVERERDLADLGVYYRRAVWHGLGSFLRGNARFRITDPVPRDIVGGIFE